MGHSWRIMKMVLKAFIPSLSSMLLYSRRFLELVRSFFPTSGLFFALPLWHPHGIFWRTQFHTIYNGSDSFPGTLYLCTIICIIKVGPLCLFENWSPFLFSLIKNPKNLVCSPILEKIKMKPIICENKKRENTKFIW